MSGRLEKKEIAGLSSVSCKHRTKNYELRTSIFLLFSLLLTLHFSGCATKQGIVKTESGLVSNATKAVPSNQKDSVISAQTNDIFMETIRSNVPILSKQGSDKVMAIISLGDVVKVLETNHNFAFIQDADNLKGWVNKTNFGSTESKALLKLISIENFPKLGQVFYYGDNIGNYSCEYTPFYLKAGKVEVKKIEIIDKEGNFRCSMLRNMSNKRVAYSGLPEKVEQRIFNQQTAGAGFLKDRLVFSKIYLDSDWECKLEENLDDIRPSPNANIYINPENEYVGITYRQPNITGFYKAFLFHKGQLVSKTYVNNVTENSGYDQSELRIINSNRLFQLKVLYDKNYDSYGIKYKFMDWGQKNY